MNMLRRLLVGGAALAGLSFLVLACAEHNAMASPSPAAAPTIDAPAGVVQGANQGAIRVFKGIPYAEPPVGDLRWRPPVALARWQGVRQATAYGAACVQPTPSVQTIYSSELGHTSEDCLTLNIWTPANAQNAPVFFWIHGGALTGGSSKETLYDGARMAAQGIVVVSINYRLGVLGWLAHPGLSAESPQNISGNYGLMDQIQALHWVHDNIGAFGGDPANVTIAGESAGGLSVMFLMTSPPARGLFAKAIMESSYMVAVQSLKEARYGPSAEQIGTMLATGLHADNVAALRAMDAQHLTDAAAVARFFPFAAIDGVYLPRQITEAFDRGEQARVPILAGFNSGEIRSLTVLAPPPPATSAAYEAAINERYQDLAPAYLRLYPSNNMQESIFANTRDALYGWTAERLSRKQTAAGVPAYFYLFDHSTPSTEAMNLHGFHASELPYVFGNIDRTPPLWPKIPPVTGERALADAMLGYWTSFARTGHPTAAHQPDWPAYGVNKQVMLFTDAPHAAANLMPGMYELHEEAMCRRAAANQPWNWNTGIISPPLTRTSAPCP